jgi:hypothetical protein
VRDTEPGSDEIRAKYMQVRKENTEMRGLLKQNEIIINKNIE